MATASTLSSDAPAEIGARADRIAARRYDGRRLAPDRLPGHPGHPGPGNGLRLARFGGGR